jgi:hypothetical protein
MRYRYFGGLAHTDKHIPLRAFSRRTLRPCQEQITGQERGLKKRPVVA